MPLYEYACLECGHEFDKLRRASEADSPVACPECNAENARRMISVFSAHHSGGAIAGAGSSCSATSCASCSSTTCSH